VGGLTEFNARAYGEKHPGTLNWLQTNVQNASVHVSEAAQKFFTSAQELYDRFNGAEALRLAALALRKVQSIFQPESIRALNSLAEIQNAPLKMQRFIMAEPVTRRQFLEQKCDGYSDTFVNVHGNDIGATHHDYRLAVHGFVQPIENDDEYEWKAEFYPDSLDDDEAPLTHLQQQDIQSTWDLVRAAFERGKEDPTSPMGTLL
jgi:hypothetical protein